MSGQTNQNKFLLPTGGSHHHSSSSSTASQRNAANSNQDYSSTNKLTDCQQENNLSVDTDFDSYWEEEARNPHRNRIRIGRQYQATVPALLKAGEKDHHAELEHYFTVAKSLNLFASLVETRSLLGRDVTIADLNHIRNKEGLSLASVIQPTRQHQQPLSSSSSNNANQQPVATPVSNTHAAGTLAELATGSDCQLSPSSVGTTTGGASSALDIAAKQQFHAPNQALMKALSHFISLHHPCHHDSDCKKIQKEQPLQDDSVPAVSITSGNLRPASMAAISASNKEKTCRSRSALKQLKEESAQSSSEVDIGESSSAASEPTENQTAAATPSYYDWTREEVEQFSKAIEVCGKNFGSIKKDFLPSKSVKSIVEYYYIGSRDSSDSRKKSSQSAEASDSCSNQDKLNNNGGQGGGGGAGSAAGGNINNNRTEQAGPSASSGSVSNRNASSNFKSESGNPMDDVKLFDGSPDNNQAETSQCASGRLSTPNSKSTTSKQSSNSKTEQQVGNQSKGHKTSIGKKTDPRMSVYNFDDENRDESPLRLECPKPGAEVKPLKAKPIVPGHGSDSDAANANVGSLKFFMDGQLVLKLNACQEQQEGKDKCHWVQSGDNVANSMRQKRYTKRGNQGRSSSQNGSSQNNSLVSSYQDEDSKKEPSGDEDSKESTISSSNLSSQKLPQQHQLQQFQQQIQQSPSPVSKRLRVKSEPNSARQPEGQPLGSPIDYNSLTPTGNHAVPQNANPMISQAMPWLNANSFAMAAALLGGFTFPQNQPNLIDTQTQMLINNSSTCNNSNPINSNMSNNNSSSNHSVGINQSSKPMDLTLEHSSPSPKTTPKASSRSKSSSRPKNT